MFLAHTTTAAKVPATQSNAVSAVKHAEAGGLGAFASPLQLQFQKDGSAVVQATGQFAASNRIAGSTPDKSSSGPAKVKKPKHQAAPASQGSTATASTAASASVAASGSGSTQWSMPAAPPSAAQLADKFQDDTQEQLSRLKDAVARAEVAAHSAEAANVSAITSADSASKANVSAITSADSASKANSAAGSSANYAAQAYTAAASVAKQISAMAQASATASATTQSAGTTTASSQPAPAASQPAPAAWQPAPAAASSAAPEATPDIAAALDKLKDLKAEVEQGLGAAVQAGNGIALVQQLVGLVLAKVGAAASGNAGASASAGASADAGASASSAGGQANKKCA